jgi:PAS domain S-box-containing protein
LPEPRFDRITAIAKHLFEMPIVLISLIDSDRQWFKSRQGLDACETPRNISFCGHAILSDAILNVPDAMRDGRFADNPLVTGPPNIRAYIGAPLRLVSGLRIGTLCLIDTKPRQLDTEALTNLRHLADWVQDELQRMQLSDAVATIRVQEAQLHAILSNVADAILTVDGQARILSANAQTEALFAVSRADLLGAQLQTLLPKYPVAQFQKWVVSDVSAQMDAPQPLRRDTLGRRGNGQEFPIEMAVTVMGSKEGRAYIISISDQSETQRLDRMKSEFVSTVSHELRTPLTAIQGSLGLIAGGAAGPVPAKMEEMLKIATGNCERLVFLVNDILDLEKLELGRMSFNRVKLPLAALIAEAVELNQSYAAGFDVALLLQGAEAPEVCLHADKQRIMQVLTNLIANAAKFSPPGEVVSIETSTVIDGSVRIGIRDHGPGIPDDMREQVFEKFVQIEGVEAQRKGGSGLGLSISKAIVEAFGGRIGVESPPEGGSLFYIEMPVESV